MEDGSIAWGTWKQSWLLGWVGSAPATWNVKQDKEDLWCFLPYINLFQRKINKSLKDLNEANTDVNLVDNSNYFF